MWERQQRGEPERIVMRSSAHILAHIKMAAYTKMPVTASSPSRTRSGLANPVANLQDKGAVVLDIGRVYTK